MYDDCMMRQYTQTGFFFYDEISRKPTDPVIIILNHKALFGGELSRGEQVESGHIENVLYRQDVVEGAR